MQAPPPEGAGPAGYATGWLVNEEGAQSRAPAHDAANAGSQYARGARRSLAPSIHAPRQTAPQAEANDHHVRSNVDAEAIFPIRLPLIDRIECAKADM